MQFFFIIELILCGDSFTFLLQLGLDGLPMQVLDNSISKLPFFVILVCLLEANLGKVDTLELVLVEDDRNGFFQKLYPFEQIGNLKNPADNRLDLNLSLCNFPAFYLTADVLESSVDKSLEKIVEGVLLSLIALEMLVGKGHLEEVYSKELHEEE